MTLDEVEAEVDRRIAIWGKGPGYRFLRVRDDMGAPHVEGADPAFQWIVTERGAEIRREVMDAAELTFVTVSGVARGIAAGEELRTRGAGYSRGTWMDGHIRLMALQSDDWSRRVARGYAETLRRHPLSAEELAAERRLDLRAYGCLA